jgi:hypothetical protein
MGKVRCPKPYHIKYDETIVVCTAKNNGEKALLLENYSKDEYRKFEAVGPVSGPEFDPHTGKLLPEMSKRNIGQLFDAVDIVRFQQQIMKVARAKRAVRKLEPEHWTDYFFSIFDELGSVSVVRSSSLDKKMLTAVEAMILTPEGQTGPVRVRGQRGGHQVDRAVDLRKAAESYESYKNLGFTGYFPQPSLILQEERTSLILNTDKGQTANEDKRDIEPIQVYGQKLPPPQKHKTEYGDVKLTPTAPRFEYEDLAELMDDELKKLYKGLKRISCFAFRTDTRDPVKIYAAGGFLPGVTRTDQSYMAKKDPTAHREVSELAKEIDDSRTDPQKYLELMQRHYAHLEKFLGDQTFKAFISTTKSIALAKCFANYWDKTKTLRPGWGRGSHPNPDVGDAFCYAVRCKGGIQVQFGHEKHPIAKFFEQEVTKLGAIWKEDIVGFRRIRTDQEGQFLSGPIFLQDRLKEIDPNAFRMLFMLLSGKKQGESKGIEKSYPDCPWEQHSWPID